MKKLAVLLIILSTISVMGVYFGSKVFFSIGVGYAFTSLNPFNTDEAFLDHGVIVAINVDRINGSLIYSPLMGVLSSAEMYAELWGFFFTYDKKAFLGEYYAGGYSLKLGSFKLGIGGGMFDGDLGLLLTASGDFKQIRFRGGLAYPLSGSPEFWGELSYWLGPWPVIVGASWRSGGQFYYAGFGYGVSGEAVRFSVSVDRKDLLVGDSVEVVLERENLPPTLSKNVEVKVILRNPDGEVEELGRMKIGDEFGEFERRMDKPGKYVVEVVPVGFFRVESERTIFQVHHRPKVDLRVEDYMPVGHSMMRLSMYSEESDEYLVEILDERGRKIFDEVIEVSGWKDLDVPLNVPRPAVKSFRVLVYGEELVRKDVRFGSKVKYEIELREIRALSGNPIRLDRTNFFVGDEIEIGIVKRPSDGVEPKPLETINVYLVCGAERKFLTKMRIVDPSRKISARLEDNGNCRIELKSGERFSIEYNSLSFGVHDVPSYVDMIVPDNVPLNSKADVLLGLNANPEDEYLVEVDKDGEKIREFRIRGNEYVKVETLRGERPGEHRYTVLVYGRLFPGSEKLVKVGAGVRYSVSSSMEGDVFIGDEITLVFRKQDYSPEPPEGSKIGVYLKGTTTLKLGEIDVGESEKIIKFKADRRGNYRLVLVPSKDFDVIYNSFEYRVHQVPEAFIELSNDTVQRGDPATATINLSGPGYDYYDVVLEEEGRKIFRKVMGGGEKAEVALDTSRLGDKDYVLYIYGRKFAAAKLKVRSIYRMKIISGKRLEGDIRFTTLELSRQPMMIKIYEKTADGRVIPVKNLRFKYKAVYHDLRMGMGENRMKYFIEKEAVTDSNGEAFLDLDLLPSRVTISIIPHLSKGYTTLAPQSPLKFSENGEVMFSFDIISSISGISIEDVKSDVGNVVLQNKTVYLIGTTSFVVDYRIDFKTKMEEMGIDETQLRKLGMRGRKVEVLPKVFDGISLKDAKGVVVSETAGGVIVNVSDMDKSKPIYLLFKVVSRVDNRVLALDFLRVIYLGVPRMEILGQSRFRKAGYSDIYVKVSSDFGAIRNMGVMLKMRSEQGFLGGTTELTLRGITDKDGIAHFIAPPVPPSGVAIITKLFIPGTGETQTEIEGYEVKMEYEPSEESINWNLKLPEHISVSSAGETPLITKAGTLSILVSNYYRDVVVKYDNMDFLKIGEIHGEVLYRLLKDLGDFVYTGKVTKTIQASVRFVGAPKDRIFILAVYGLESGGVKGNEKLLGVYNIKNGDRIRVPFPWKTGKLFFVPMYSEYAPRTEDIRSGSTWSEGLELQFNKGKVLRVYTLTNVHDGVWKNAATYSFYIGPSFYGKVFRGLENRVVLLEYEMKRVKMESRGTSAFMSFYRLVKGKQIKIPAVMKNAEGKTEFVGTLDVVSESEERFAVIIRNEVAGGRVIFVNSSPSGAESKTFRLLSETWYGIPLFTTEISGESFFAGEGRYDVIAYYPASGESAEVTIDIRRNVKRDILGEMLELSEFYLDLGDVVKNSLMSSLVNLKNMMYTVVVDGVILRRDKYLNPWVRIPLADGLHEIVIKSEIFKEDMLRLIVRIHGGNHMIDFPVIDDPSAKLVELEILPKMAFLQIRFKDEAMVSFRTTKEKSEKRKGYTVAPVSKDLIEMAGVHYPNEDFDEKGYLRNFYAVVGDFGRINLLPHRVKGREDERSVVLKIKVGGMKGIVSGSSELLKVNKGDVITFIFSPSVAQEAFMMLCATETKNTENSKKISWLPKRLDLKDIAEGFRTMNVVYKNKVIRRYPKPFAVKMSLADLGERGGGEYYEKLRSIWIFGVYQEDEVEEDMGVYVVPMSKSFKNCEVNLFAELNVDPQTLRTSDYIYLYYPVEYTIKDHRVVLNNPLLKRLVDAVRESGRDLKEVERDQPSLKDLVEFLIKNLKDVKKFEEKIKTSDSLDDILEFLEENLSKDEFEEYLGMELREIGVEDNIDFYLIDLDAF